MIRRLTLTLALLMLCLLAAPPVASAFDPFANDCNGSTPNATVCQTQTVANNNPSANPIQDELAKITNIVAWAGGAAAVIVILVSAMRFITSGSDISTGSRTDTDVENARRALGGAVIGLVIIVLARTLILFVLGKL